MGNRPRSRRKLLCVHVRVEGVGRRDLNMDNDLRIIVVGQMMICKPQLGMRTEDRRSGMIYA